MARTLSNFVTGQLLAEGVHLSDYLILNAAEQSPLVSINVDLINQLYSQQELPVTQHSTRVEMAGVRREAYWTKPVT